MLLNSTVRATPTYSNYHEALQSTKRTREEIALIGTLLPLENLYYWAGFYSLPGQQTYMTTTPDSERGTALSPDEAFSVLGDETRLQILQVLGEANGALAFSELFKRIDYEDSSNFQYHLDKLVGHFVTKADGEYRLQQAGRRVVEAILSGTVTDNPVLEPTEVDERCPICSAAMKVGYQQERAEMYCTECAGLFDSASSDPRLGEDGYLGHMSLPPVGVDSRSPAEILKAAWTWKHLDVVADSSGICSRCSAPLDHSVSVCEDHDSASQSCDECGRQYAAEFVLRCTNCNYSVQSIAPGVFLANTELLAFLTEHGVNPIAPSSFNDAMAAVANYDEEIDSTDPFKGEFTFGIDDAEIVLTVDENLDVVDTTRRSASGSNR